MESEFWRKYTLERHNQLNCSKLEYALFLAIGVGGSIAISVSSGNPESLSTLDAILVNAKCVWLAYAPIAAISGYGILRCSPKEDFHLERRAQSGDYKVVFQITTRGFNKEAVERSVKSVLYWAPKYLKNYEVWVVTEEDVDKGFFEKLKEVNGGEKVVKVVYVPSDYKTPNNTRYKARALHYAAELRKRLRYDPEKTWVYLMDEESIVGEDTVLGIVDFIENESKKGRLVGQGLIVYPNFWGKNILASLEDSIRAGDDISRYNLQAKMGKVVVGVHGSHLLYRLDVEEKVGWDFGLVRAEDTMFGLLVNKYFGSVLGWLKGKLYEQSPFSIREFMKQRRRWVWGSLDILLKRGVGLKYKLVVVASVISWLSSLPSIVVAYINLVYPTPLPHPLASIPLGFSIATLAYIYWEGSKLNLQPTRKDSLWRRVLNVLAIPVIAPLEGLAAWYGLLTYRKSREIGFEVIKK